MLRPERMSKVSVTGSKGVMPTVIETIHELHVVHLSDYDGSWTGFDNGNPIEGADRASEQLVTVRSLESVLDVDEDDAGPGRLEADWEDRLERIREQVNDLDDRRDEVRNELRQIQEKIDRVAPFAELGIDLDLLSGYDSVDVVVGEGNVDELESALEASEEVRAYETFTGGDVVAIVAAPTEDADEDVIDDALVGVEFTRHSVPETEQSPEAYVDELEHRKRQLESDLDDVDSELERIKLDEAGFLLRAEEKLTVEVQRAEAPLQFATTDRAFVAEGWIPTDTYDTFVAELDAAVGDSVEIEELERADYDRHGALHHTEDVQHGGPAAADEEPAEREEEPQKAATDGGVVTMNDEPPTVQDNPSPAKPFEVLVNAVSRPKYSELDPTVTLLLTFPLFFGFMIGDLGYGILYVAIGYYMYSNFESAGIKSLGGIAIWAGVFTAIFGVLYGEFFGLHELGKIVWPSGHPPIEKGLSPATIEFALAWITVTLIAGVVHLTIGYVLDFYENLSHGVWNAITHSGSWILMLVGLWTWVFSRQAESIKPEFMFEVFNGEPFPLGFAGFPAMGIFTIPEAVPGVGGALITLPIVMLLTGLVLLAVGDTVELVESLSILSETFSYTRMAAVLLAKAGMALVVNLMFFGMYTHDGEFHYMTQHGPAYVESHYGSEAIVFGGFVNSGIAGLAVGLVILVFGHLLVLALGVTSAGLQAVRLEYVEFFGKFYEGGGKNYEPFGHDQKHSED